MKHREMASQLQYLCTNHDSETRRDGFDLCTVQYTDRDIRQQDAQWQACCARGPCQAPYHAGLPSPPRAASRVPNVSMPSRLYTASGTEMVKTRAATMAN